MSQVSPPLRIALIAAIAFLGVWALFLRPQPEPPVEPDATTPAVVAPATAAPATGAPVGATAATATEPVAPATGTTGAVPVSPVTSGTSTDAVAPAQPPIALNREALAQLPPAVGRAVRRDRVIALLFWNPKAADDRRVRRWLSSANTHGDRVFVRAASVDDISRYAPITRGVDVSQTPTIVVVDRDLHAESLVGYVARTTIRQALSDAVRAGS